MIPFDTRHVLLTSLALFSASPIPAPTPENSGCQCQTVTDDFPKSIASSVGVAQGTLTHSIFCSSTANDCTASGNITWTPDVACSPTGVWSNVNSYSVAVNGTPPSTAFSNCSTATSNPHTIATATCTSSNQLLTFFGIVRDSASPPNDLGAAFLVYNCKIF